MKRLLTKLERLHMLYLNLTAPVTFLSNIWRSVTVYEIFANQIKCKKSDLKIKVEVRKERGIGRAQFDRYVSIYIWCFRIFVAQRTDTRAAMNE